MEIRTHAELNKAIFDAMLNLLYQSPATPAVRAAAYRLLADLPGVRDRGAVTDPLGRACVAFTFTVNEEQPGVRMADTGGPQEVRLIFDPTSGQPLAWGTYQLRPVDYLSWVPAGALFSYRAVVRTGWTDDAPPTVRDVRSENGPRSSAADPTVAHPTVCAGTATAMFCGAAGRKPGSHTANGEARAMTGMNGRYTVGNIIGVLAVMLFCVGLALYALSGDAGHRIGRNWEFVTVFGVLGAVWMGWIAIRAIRGRMR